MHWYAFKIDYHLKDKLKEKAKAFGMRSRFDYRMKRWEVYGKKLSGKRLKELEDLFGEVWSWQTDYQQDPYSKAVYSPRNVKNQKCRT